MVPPPAYNDQSVNFSIHSFYLIGYSNFLFDMKFLSLLVSELFQIKIKWRHHLRMEKCQLLTWELFPTTKSEGDETFSLAGV